MEQAPNRHFRFRVLVSDPRHDPLAVFGTDPVSHDEINSA